MSTRNTLAPHPTLEPERRRDETFRRFGARGDRLFVNWDLDTLEEILSTRRFWDATKRWLMLTGSFWFWIRLLGLLKLEKDMVANFAFNLKCWQIVCEKSPNPDVGVQIHPKPPHKEQSLLLDSTNLQASAHSKSGNQMLRCDWHIQTDLTTIYMWKAYIFLEHDSLAHMFFPSAVGRCQKAPGA